MSWFTDTFFGKSTKIHDPNIPLVDVAADVFGDYGSGGPTTMKSAAAVSTFRSCVRVIAETVASLQIELLDLRNGTVKPAVDDYRYDLIKYEPHPNYTSMTYFEAGTSHIAALGNHYAYKEYDSSGRVASLNILDPEHCEPFLYKGKKYYRYHKANATYSDEDIIHVPAQAHDGIKGVNVIKEHSITLGALKSATEMSHRTYENGAYVSGILSTDKALKDDAKQRLVKSWMAAYAGSKKAGGTPLLEDGMKFQQIRMSPVDIQMIQQMEFGVRDISRLLRVPLHLLNSLERSTNNNIEQQSIDFVVHTIRPYLKRWESELNRKLLSKEERRYLKFKFNIESLLRGDSKARAEFYNKLFMMGSISQNEIRAQENMNPIPGGDKYYIMVNMADSETNTKVGDEK